MDDLFKQLAQYGALGLVAAVSLYQVNVMQKQLFGLIKDTTKALIELRETIKDCQCEHGKIKGRG